MFIDSELKPASRDVSRRNLLIGTGALIALSSLACGGEKPFLKEDKGEGYKAQIYLLRGLSNPQEGWYDLDMNPNYTAGLEYLLEGYDLIQEAGIKLTMELRINRGSIVVQTQLFRTRNMNFADGWQASLQPFRPEIRHTLRTSWKDWRFNSSLWNGLEISRSLPKGV